MIPNDYINRTYAGFLGMNVGIRLGAPVEPTLWTRERIDRFYGDITGYVKNFKNFAADDDVNGPVFFLRALYDDAKDRELTPQDVANAWLNYTREEVGMFWWGGYGVSTEHTAYLNLKAGIPAPKSGSKEVNGLTLAEQIGGQIFIDTWGLIFPGNIEKAADYAGMAASVSHDGNGVYGARFIAACIAAAYNAASAEDVIKAGLSVIPIDSTYSKVVNGVMEFYRNHPTDFKLCLKYLHDNWGYDKYPGVCHIIPNAGVIVLSILYGRSFNRSIEIATMCGWDTDCNAGNVGTIMGVLDGLDSIAAHYRKPINDSVVLSSISGYLNILDIPTYVKELALLAYRLSGESIPPELENSYKPGEVHFDFELPGSTHNLRLSNTTDCSIRHSTERAYTGKGSVEVLFDRMVRGQSCKIYYKPFYRREDFDDERYMPVFSPTAYPGQEVSLMVFAERFNGESIVIHPYVRNSSSNEEVLIGGMIIREPQWNKISFTIPDLKGGMVDEIGIILEANSPQKNKDLGCLYIDDFKISGKGKYTIDISKQKKEFASITPFSHNHGSWEIVGDKIEAMALNHAEAMTGNYFMKDVRVVGKITPHTGFSHLISARVQGALRGYYAGFNKDGVAIYKNDKGMIELIGCKFSWQHEREYTLELIALGETLSLMVDGNLLLEVKDDTHGYGMVGYAMYEMGRSGFGNLSVEEL